MPPQEEQHPAHPISDCGRGVGQLHQAGWISLPQSDQGRYLAVCAGDLALPCARGTL